MTLSKIFIEPIWDRKTVGEGFRPISSDDKLVTLNIPVFERFWSGPLGHGFYIPPYDNSGRYNRVLERWYDGLPVSLAEIGIIPFEGTMNIMSLGFTNGRHCYAAARDLGLKTMPVAMDRSSLAVARYHHIIL